MFVHWVCNVFEQVRVCIVGMRPFSLEGGSGINVALRALCLFVIEYSLLRNLY